MGWVKEWREERRDTETLNRAKKRLGSLRSTEMVEWAEACLYGIGRNLTDWRSPLHSDLRGDALHEAVVNAEVLLLIVEELRVRQDARAAK